MLETSPSRSKEHRKDGRLAFWGQNWGMIDCKIDLEVRTTTAKESWSYIFFVRKSGRSG